MFFSLILYFIAIIQLQVFSKTAEEWKSRSIYQIITDRFARTDGSTEPCYDLTYYCGGTFKGIQSNLDYIQGMGFDAIWISPVVANTPGGYHGYWTSNLYEINPYFGTSEELKELIDACHERDIWVMVDVVANHIGYVDNWDYSSIVPFSDSSYFNKYRDCAEVDPKDHESLETCWLSGLPDLDQNHPFVREIFLGWVADFVQTYNIDALRIDTVPHVSKEFWTAFSKVAGVYTLGEILNFDLDYLAEYQGPVQGVINYALYSTLRYAFQDGGSMNSMEEYYKKAYITWPDVTTLGNFVNNHDNPRFLNSTTSNHETFKAALAFSICSVGIPIVYYGDEQGFSGGADPTNREALWTNIDTQTDTYQFLRKINNFRKRTEFYKFEQVQRYSDYNFYAFTRGEYLFAFTNSKDTQTRTITYHEYPEGTLLCNIFHERDCVQVQNGEFPVVLLNGEVKIFEPAKRNQARRRDGMLQNIKLELRISSSVFDTYSG